MDKFSSVAMWVGFRKSVPQHKYLTLDFHYEGLGLIPKQSMWVLWWTKWYWSVVYFRVLWFPPTTLHVIDVSCAFFIIIG